MAIRKGRIRSFQMIFGVCLLTLSLPLAYSQEGTVTLFIGDGGGLPGSTDNPVQISLDNLDDRTTGIQVDVCDTNDFLTPALNDPPPGYFCETTGRAAAFACSAIELASGCVRLIIADFEGGGFIEVGTGPIINLRYDVSEEAPLGECRDLFAEDAIITSCVEDGEGGCGTGAPFESVNLDDGEFCFGDPITTTTTTTTPVTTTTTTPSSTTTTASTSYTVSISPMDATLDSGATLQFTARTTLNGQEVSGLYGWEIVNGSTIGSTIDDEGLFSAGDNTMGTDIEETVKVTDTDHDNQSATATVTVKVKKISPECEVSVNPSSATVASGDSLTLSASTIGDDCESGDYEWSISTDIESMIDQEGNYTAGLNSTGSQTTDVITVVDHANSDISGSATINVESEAVVKDLSVFPSTLLGSRWIPLPYLLLILGEDTNFNLQSTVTFEPAEYIVKLFHFGFGRVMYVMVWLRANPDEGAVSISIDTEGEVTTGEFTLQLLPFQLADGYAL
jgi:hypothetical protein